MRLRLCGRLQFDTGMEVDSEGAGGENLPNLDKDVLPELEAYAYLLVIMYCVDNGLFEEVGHLSSQITLSRQKQICFFSTFQHVTF